MKPWGLLTINEKLKYCTKHKLTLLTAQTRYQREYYHYQEQLN